MKLVIVESPAKARTISNFLGKDFKVESSYGHIRDLPKSTLAIDVEKNFEPHYIIPRKAKKTVKHLKELAEKSDEVILATDEDREGEAIAWHLAEALGLEKRGNVKNAQRIVFHEITKNAIENALKNPRQIDINLVNAQQARRVLDRLVGYKLSPFLWKKIMARLSAGRVQSVALRFIVDREKEIRIFKSEKYWTILAMLLKPEDKEKKPFEAILVEVGGQTIPPPGLKEKEVAENIVEILKKADFKVQDAESQILERKPLPPFITSTLQQAAWQHLHFSAKKTMLISQQLYEGIEIKNEDSVGLITYMRTDSVNIAEEALKNAQLFLRENLGEKYALAKPRRFKTKSRVSQEAHEAIRSTDPARKPELIKSDLTPDQYKLYNLIWQRFIASQMPNAVFEQTTALIEVKSSQEYLFQTKGTLLKFDGFLKIYPVKIEENILPEFRKNDELLLKEIDAKEHQTQPPARYTEASLVRALEKFGIGRPSTYAPIMSTIEGRGYAFKDEQKHFVPSEIGEKVTELLVENFPEIIDINFTARMEGDLDDIAENKKEWTQVVGDFYAPFEKNLEEKYKTVKKQEINEPINESCEKCGKPMVIRYGRFGKFIACSGFPECKNTKEFPTPPLNIKCPLCKKGEVVMRKTKRGRVFYGCSEWPKCNFATWQKPTGELCLECSSPMVEVRGKVRCSNKNCIFKLGRKMNKK